MQPRSLGLAVHHSKLHRNRSSCRPAILICRLRETNRRGLFCFLHHHRRRAIRPPVSLSIPPPVYWALSLPPTRLRARVALTSMRAPAFAGFGLSYLRGSIKLNWTLGV